MDPPRKLAISKSVHADFRAAYDAIQAVQPGTKGDLAYLRILHLAASTLEADVAAALVQRLARVTGTTSGRSGR